MSDLFKSIQDSLLNLDPVYFAENNLTLDGKPFRINGNGYKPLSDIYRYIGVKALERTAKPVVILKGRQVGMTTACSVLELYWMSCGLFGFKYRPPIRVMHCFPQLELAYAYTKTKLNSMINSAVVEDTNKYIGKKQKNVIQNKLDNIPSNDSLNYKQFIGGNHIWIESIGIDGDRVRGRSVDVLLMDECQDMRGPAISATTKIASKANYGEIGSGVQVYFGTPKQKGTDFWRIWNASSQQYYYLGCEKCNEHFPLYTPGSDDWEKIWLYGYIVKCTKCGHEQDKRLAAERGKWVSHNSDEDSRFIGYHINQLYMPEFTKEKILSEKPENHPFNTERTYMNEVMGEFYAGGAGLITTEQIDEMCAERERGFSSRILPSDNKRVYLGLDWGEKSDLEQLSADEHKNNQQGHSYSCAVILTTDGPHILQIEYATRLKNNKFEYKKEFVEELFRRYSVDLAVSDIGGANDLSSVLQEQFGNKFLCSRAAHKINGKIRFKTDVFPLTIDFEKDYIIGEAIDMLKSGKIKFPYKNYEQIAWLVQHCCSMNVKSYTDRSGLAGMKYVKGTTPNDGFMALINALLALKFDISNGFKITHPKLMKTDPAQRQPIPCVGAYIPGMNPIKR